MIKYNPPGTCLAAQHRVVDIIIMRRDFFAKGGEKMLMYLKENTLKYHSIRKISFEN